MFGLEQFLSGLHVNDFLLALRSLFSVFMAILFTEVVFLGLGVLLCMCVGLYFLSPHVHARGPLWQISSKSSIRD